MDPAALGLPRGPRVRAGIGERAKSKRTSSREPRHNSRTEGQRHSSPLPKGGPCSLLACELQPLRRGSQRPLGMARGLDLASPSLQSCTFWAELTLAPLATVGFPPTRTREEAQRLCCVVLLSSTATRHPLTSSCILLEGQQPAEPRPDSPVAKTGSPISHPNHAHSEFPGTSQVTPGLPRSWVVQSRRGQDPQSPPPWHARGHHPV